MKFFRLLCTLVLSGVTWYLRDYSEDTINEMFGIMQQGTQNILYPLILLTFNRQGFIIRLEAIKDICGVQ